MMNEHNPVAVRINRIQQKWKSQVEGKNYKVVRFLLSNEDDLTLLNGFYKLESSIYRTIDEVLVVMLTDFENLSYFSYNLVKDWILEYEKGLKKIPDLPWKEFPLYKEKIEKASPLQPQGHLLLEMLASYQQCISDSPKKLRIGIVPRKVYSYSDFSKWLKKMAVQLPENIGILLTDYTQDNFYAKVVGTHEYTSISLTVEDQDMKGAYEELIKGGNPNDPQVKFRTCMLEMGKEAAAGYKKGVHNWGNKLLDLAQSTGDKSLWASAHLIYAGFLFRFKDEQIHSLLDKGVIICESLIKYKDEAGLGILLQIYNYKASYYSICGQHQKSWEWFIKSTQKALDNKHYLEAISNCKNAIIMAERHFMKSEMTEYLETGAFQLMYQQEDEQLKATEITFIVNYYLGYSSQVSQEKYREINERMILIFGKEWRQQVFSKVGMSPSTSVT